MASAAPDPHSCPVTLRAFVLAVGAGLALADGSIVTLGLPQILHDLNTTVEGVAAVIGLYTFIVAVVLVPLETRRRASLGPRRRYGGVRAARGGKRGLRSGDEPPGAARGARRTGGRRGSGARHRLRAAGRRAGARA
jgi:hypothetical protein